ncbi:MAG: uL22 family ribosomal protein [Candidatus Aenigmatarchaeota archaeon]
MPYTFKPKYEHAKAYGNNLAISTKSAQILCRVISNKPLNRAKRLLNDLANERRSLEGKYHTTAVKGLLELLNSCEKNAEFMGLTSERLFVHAGATHGNKRRRPRRRSKFGHILKATNVEIMLIQRGKEGAKKKKTKEEVARDAVRSKIKEKLKTIVVPKEVGTVETKTEEKKAASEKTEVSS